MLQRNLQSAKEILQKEKVIRMARSVFFSFHYDRDIWRVEIIRNHYITKGTYQVAGFFDHSKREKVKKQGQETIKRFIHKGLKYTTVTAVLIGTKTAEREWVTYEILESCNKGNGMLGIYIHKLRDENGRVDTQGKNPFCNVKKLKDNQLLSEIIPTYDWVDDNGYDNFQFWVEKAANCAGKL